MISKHQKVSIENTQSNDVAFCVEKVGLHVF